jgi:intracellular multiplication protein IcmO
MPNLKQRGLEAYQEQVSAELIRDTRTFGQKVLDFFKNQAATSILITAFIAGCIALPGMADVLLLIGCICFIVSKVQRQVLPFRLPKRANRLDFNSPAPGTNKPGMAGGIYYFGNNKRDNDELWFTNEDMKTHVLMFGSTGSGKTETLISLAYNALIQSSGFIYVDGKGDNALFTKIYSMARYMGREDDLLLINFMTGARDIIGPQEKRLSNTMNPFARGSSSMLSQLIVSLMDSASGKSDSDMWKGRAISFVEALMRVLVPMRDAGHVLLDANIIRNYFSLERLESIVLDKIFVRDNQEPVSLEGFPEVIWEPIANYLFNLPGYQKAKKGKQVSQVYEQHGYITMQLTRVFTSLADTYGHILRTNLPEVDLRDVVLNRRLLVVLLPALEKSPDELANLGKVIIASLRVMMAAGLGDEIEGMYNQIIERKPTNANTPFLCILDEYGYYAVPGFAVVPAQARSLGFSVVFAGQDLPALQKASKEEAATIGANTNIKICMKLEDPMETWEFFMKTAGESYVTHVGGFQTDAGSLTNQYLDSKSAQLEKRARVDLLDLKEQREGEAHVFFKSKIVRAKLFYANPKPVHEVRVNQFVKIDYPPDNMIRNLANGFENLKVIAEAKDALANLSLSDPATEIVKIFNKNVDDSPIERGIATLLSYHEEQAELPMLEMQQEEMLPSGEIDIFTPLRASDKLKRMLRTKNYEEFSKPLLDKKSTLSKVAHLERLDGKAEQYANNIAIELIKDLKKETNYPPIKSTTVTGGEIGTAILDLVGKIILKKQETAKKDAGGAT